MATEPLPDPCSWPAGDCPFTDETRQLREKNDALRARVAELSQLLDEAGAYVHSFARISKHPTAPTDAMNLVARIRCAVSAPEVPK